MAIYDINSNVLTDAYDLADSIETAYDINGDVVYQHTPPQRDYDDYTITNLFRYPVSKMQGFAIYNGIIAQVREDYSLHLIDIATQTKIREVSMDMGHGNSCQFSDEFYDADDEFPLFYIRNTGVWVYRIVGTESTLIRKYSFSADIIGTYVAGFGIDNANRRFYTASYTTGDYISKTGQMRICEWDMDDVTDNGDDTYSMALIDSNDFSWFDRFEAVQGCTFHDGYFFISCGYTGNSQQNVVLVDPATLSIAHIISLGASPETEGCDWYYDEYLIVGQKISTYTYRKIEFAELAIN